MAFNTACCQPEFCSWLKPSTAWARSEDSTYPMPAMKGMYLSKWVC